MIRIKKIYLLLSLLFFIFNVSMAQTEVIPLWTGSIPNQQESDEKEIQENLEVYWVRNI